MEFANIPGSVKWMISTTGVSTIRKFLHQNKKFFRRHFLDPKKFICALLELDIKKFICALFRVLIF